MLEEKINPARAKSSSSAKERLKMGYHNTEIEIAGKEQAKMRHYVSLNIKW